MTSPPGTPEIEPPSSMELVRSTIFAFLAAAAVLIALVLPHEYGIDLLGAGKLLGILPAAP